MKYFYLFFIASIFIHTSVTGQEQLEQAPLNPEFKEYRESLKLKSQPETKKNGYVPPPYKVSFQNFDEKEETLKASQQLPDSYDLREEGYVTEVKDQDTLGTCWAFSSLGAIESRWKILKDSAYDLSEKNMVVCSGYEWGPSDGGNVYMATAYLNRFDGPIDETLDPYNELTDSSECTVREDPLALVPEARYLPKDIDEVKRIIKNYGAVATSMYASDQFEYYNFTDYTWYYDGDKQSDHGILIVGWDDNKEVTGGSESPDTKGAWIIKNSWSEDWGENGYFYLAYKDSKVLADNAFYPIKWDNTSIDSLHYYDKLGMVTSLSYGERDVLYGLTRFEAQPDEAVKKVGTYVNNYGSVIDITVYEDFNEGQPENPVDSVTDRQILYPGYYTFDIKADLKGEFYVKVKYDVNGYEYPLPVEASISDYADPEIEESGTHWFSPDGDEWSALGSDVDSPYDLCIRAYTQKKDIAASFDTDKNFYCISETVTFTNKSSGDIDSYQWYFGEGAQPSEATGPGPHDVTYSTNGTKTISLTTEGANGKDSTSKVDDLLISENLHIFFDSLAVETSIGDTVELQINGEADQYEWSGEGSEDRGLISTSGATAWVTYDGETEDTLKYTVTGSSGQCSDSDSILVAFESKSAVGTDEISTGNGEIHLFPNPTSGHFNIVFKNKIYRDIQVEIFSIGGKRIYNEKIHKMGANENHTVTIPESQAGVYFLRIRSREDIYTKKLIIE